MQKQCKTCGTSFSKPHNVSKKIWQGRRYCSVKCRTAQLPPPAHGSSLLLKCKQCNTEYRVKFASYKRDGSRFCSRKCQALGMDRPKASQHWNWKGGISDRDHLLRQTPQYKEWRNAVYKRDNWTCQLCCRKQKHPIAHHIKNFRVYVPLRFSVDNGVTLCRSCHKIVHQEIGRKTQFTPTWKIKNA